MSMIEDNELNKAAKNAGFLYLLLIPIGMFGLAYVPAMIVVPGDMETTLANLNSSETLFRLGLVSALVMNLVSIALVLELYKLFKNVAPGAALYMLVFLVPGAGISMVGEAFGFAALELALDGDPTVFVAETSQYWVGLFIDMRMFTSHIAVIFWGVWLLPLGYLVIKSKFMPKVLGMLLVVAGVGYIVDSATHFLLSDFGFTFSDFTFIGELTLTLWLVFKGVKTGSDTCSTA